jgi:hypothetical protein
MSAPSTLTRPLQPGTVTGPLVAAIEQTWAAIQARHPDVPDVVLTLGNGSARPGQLTLGHFHAGKWTTTTGVDAARLLELFVGGEGLSRGPRAVLGTLLHEATHGVAATRGIKDTSRQGRYHNTRFRDLATELGISVERDPAIGWSITTIPDTTAEQYADQIAQLGAALTRTGSPTCTPPAARAATTAWSPPAPATHPARSASRAAPTTPAPSPAGSARPSSPRPTPADPRAEKDEPR